MGASRVLATPYGGGKQVKILHPPLGMLSNARHDYRRHQPKGHQGERRRKNPSGIYNNNTLAGESRGLLKKTGNRGCALHQRPVTVVATTRGAPSPLRKNIPEKWNSICAAKNLIWNFVKFPPDPLQSFSLMRLCLKNIYRNTLPQVVITWSTE